MELFIVLCSGLVFAIGLYALLSKSLIKLIIGLMILGHGANLLVFSSGGLTALSPAFIKAGETQLNSQAADPLPQALVLTAIVIGFGITAYVMILFHRSSVAIGAKNTDDYLERKAS